MQFRLPGFFRVDQTFKVERGVVPLAGSRTVGIVPLLSLVDPRQSISGYLVDLLRAAGSNRPVICVFMCLEMVRRRVCVMCVGVLCSKLLLNEAHKEDKFAVDRFAVFSPVTASLAACTFGAGCLVMDSSFPLQRAGPTCSLSRVRSTLSLAD